METRLRRFINPKREKVIQPVDELLSYSVPYQLASAQTPPPVFIYQPLAKSSRESRRPEEQGLSLKAFAYDCVAPGKAPVIGDKPQRGNGPVKLQVSRRLSSGELLATPEDNSDTLEEIREGDYIVGRKQSSGSHNNSPQTISSNFGNHPRSNTSTPTVRSAPLQTTTSTSKISWSSPLSSIVTHHSTDRNSITVQTTRLSNGQDFSDTAQLNFKHSFTSDVDSSTPIESPAGSNATISALWKAEYSRLTKIYGRNAIDGDTALSSAPRRRLPSSTPSRRGSTRPLSIVLEPLQPPEYERRSLESQRSSATSGRSSSYRDDVSDAWSVARTSTASSYAASSLRTAHTSFGECDLPTTREDIRKIVQEMRSTYLRALESHPPTSPGIKLTKKKKRRPKATTSSPSGTTDGAKPPDGERQTWHGDENTSRLSSEISKKARATSNPVSGLGESYIPEDDIIVNEHGQQTELKRADSLTLGGLMIVLKAREEESSISQAEVEAPLQAPSTHLSQHQDQKQTDTSTTPDTHHETRNHNTTTLMTYTRTSLETTKYDLNTKLAVRISTAEIVE